MDNIQAQIEAKIEVYRARGCEVPTPDLLKTPEQIAGIRAAAKINTALLDLLATKIKVGVNTEALNALAYDYTLSRGAFPAPLGFGGYPKSICTSIDDQVCHGIPAKDVVLKSGDIINVDVSTIYNGYFADASRMFMVGKVPKYKQDLVGIARECLRVGVAAAKPWGFLGDIGSAVHSCARKHGYSVVTEFGGHGIGVEFHEEPFVCHIGKRNTGMLLVPGMVLTIEPMINAGKSDIYIDAANNWTAYTQDGSMSAQWEHTLLITGSGTEILTW